MAPPFNLYLRDRVKILGRGKNGGVKLKELKTLGLIVLLFAVSVIPGHYQAQVSQDIDSQLIEISREIIQSNVSIQNISYEVGPAPLNDPYILDQYPNSIIIGGDQAPDLHLIGTYPSDEEQDPDRILIYNAEWLTFLGSQKWLLNPDFDLLPIITGGPQDIHLVIPLNISTRDLANFDILLLNSTDNHTGHSLQYRGTSAYTFNRLPFTEILPGDYSLSITPAIITELNQVPDRPVYLVYHNLSGSPSAWHWEFSPALIQVEEILSQDTVIITDQELITFERSILEDNIYLVLVGLAIPLMAVAVLFNSPYFNLEKSKNRRR